MICPNLNDPQVKEEFDKLVAEIGEDAAYNKWYLYNGNVPKVEESIPFFKTIKPGVDGVFFSNPELASQVYEALGFGSKLRVSLGKELEYKDPYAKNRIKYFKKYEVLDENSKSIGTVVIEDRGNNTVILHPELSVIGKGYGKELYKAVSNKLNVTIQEWNEGGISKSDSAKKMWDSLEKEGTAKRIFDEESGDNFRELKYQSQITPQQEQQAKQLYSQYLDTIFPNSSVKDIVYHGGVKGIEKFDLSKTIRQAFGKGIYFSTNLATSLFDYASAPTDEVGYMSAEDRKKFEEENYQIYYNLINLENPQYVQDGEITYSPENPDGTLVVRELDDNNNLKEAWYVIPTSEQIHILGSKQDIEGFKEFVENQEDDEEFIPSFKPKPSNRISILKQQDFKDSLIVGEKAQPFLYWSETTSKQVSEKGVIVDKILDDRFEGRYQDTGEERTFKFSNIIDESIERGMTRNQQKFYKSTLVLGQDIDIETQQETYKGEIVEIGEEEVQIKDVNGNIIAIPYKIIFKPDAQMNLAKLVQKLKETFSTQLQIYSKSAKSVEQQKRVSSYKNILSVLENYNQVEDFTVFLEEVNDNLFRAKTVLDRIVKNESIESNEKKLYIISYVKDLLNSYKDVSEIQTIIEDFEGSDILKSYMNKFYTNYSITKNTYKRIAVPQLADLLWDYFDPKMNDKLIAVGEKPYTKQRLIDDLSDPERDIDFFNQVFIAPSNVNDVVMGLFVKMIKGGKEKARMKDFNFLNKISPIIERLKAKYGEEEYKKILSNFYTIVPIIIKNNSDEEEIIYVRKFIKTHDFDPFYKTVRDYKEKIDTLVAKRLEAEAALAIEFTPEMNAVRMDTQAEETLLRRERKRYYDAYAIDVSADKFKKKMDIDYTWDSEDFYKNLKKYYTQVTDPDLIQELDPDVSISFKNDFTGEIEHYSRNEVKRSEPDPSKFITPEWEKVVLKNPDQDISDLLKILVDEYDRANRSLPYTKRIKNNMVPALRNEQSLFDLKQTWDKVSTALAEGNLIEKVTGKIKKEFLEFWKSDQPVYQRRMDGKPYREIPISVTSIMDISESSEDIVMSTLMFIKSANNFAHMNEFVGSTEVITDFLTENDPLNEEQPERVKEEINKRKEALLSFFNQQIYGEFNTSYGPLAKIIDFLGKATAITTIGLNPKSWLANFFVGNWNNLAEGFGDRFYSVSDIMWADKQFMKMLANPEQRKILMNMIDSLDAIQGRFTKTFGDQLMSFKEKYGKLDTLFIGQDLAELQIQGAVMLAMLKRNNIPYPQDGIFTEQNTPDLQNFKNLLHAINKRNHGVYSDFDRLHFQSNAVFRLFLQFRKWVVSTFRARYMGVLSGEYRMDIEMGSIEKGWYRLFYEYFRDSLNNGMSLVEAIKDINNPNLTDIQREGIRRTLVDFLAFSIGSLLVLAMTWGDDGDEEDFFGEYFIIYYLKRLIGEIGVYLPFLGFSDKLRMVANPFGAASTLKDIISLFSLVMDFELDKDGNVSIFKEYQRDTGRFEEGDLKLWGKLSKLNAADNFLQLQDFKQLIENYEAASRM